MSKRHVMRKWLVMGSCFVVGAIAWHASPRAFVPQPNVAPSTTAGTLPRPNESAVTERTLLQVAGAPLHFERNDGQGPSGVRFLARGAGYAVHLSDTDTAILLSTAARVEDGDAAAQSAIVRARLVDASTPTGVTGEAAKTGTVNYYRGKDPSRWQQGVPTFGRVRATAVYPGIDAVYYGNQRELQYDFEIAPQADPSRIAIAFDGVDRLEIESNGDLALHVGDRVLHQQRPFSYQDGPQGREEIASRFVIDDEGRVRFALASYDTSRPLVIDPVLTYSSYFGGDSEETAYDVALGPGGSIYVTGITADLASLPTLNPFQPATGAQPDAFITKFVPNGDSLTLAFSSYLGGNDQENNAGFGFTGDIAVDAAGTAFLTGSTRSSDFPVTADAHDPTFGGNLVPDAYFAKVSSTGALVYATYLGGISTDVASGIALGPGGVAYIFGHTSSDALTEQSPVTTNAYDQVMDGGSDAFVARYTAAGALDYFTFIGGNGSEATFYDGAIAVDAAGPRLRRDRHRQFNQLPARQRVRHDTLPRRLTTGFFVVLDPSLVGAAQLRYSTYISGTNGQTWATGVAVTGTGLAYIVGFTSTTTNFPVKNALQPTVCRWQPRWLGDESGHDADRRRFAALFHVPRW